MKRDSIDRLQEDWSEQRPDLVQNAMGVILRIQTLSKILEECTQASLDEHGLQWWQYDVLSTLRRNGPPYRLSATELAEAGMLTSGAMTNRIDRLEAQGLVERAPDPADRRRVLVGLTRRGLEVIESAAESRFDSAERALEDIPAARQQALNSLLREVILAHEDQ